MRTFISATLKRAPQRKVEKFNKCRDGPGSIQGGGGGGTHIHGTKVSWPEKES